MMSRSPLSPYDLVVGAVAGATGTFAMDVLLYRRHRREGGRDGFIDWERSATTRSFDDGAAPAQVGRRLARSVGVEIPPRFAGTTNSVVHWTTGVTWGVTGGAVAAVSGIAVVPVGIAVGLAAFVTSYAVLVPSGIYKPIREYDAETLSRDASAHALYGTVCGLALAALQTARAAGH